MAPLFLQRLVRHPLTHSRRIHVILTASFVLALMSIIRLTPGWSLVDYRSFDYLSTLRPPTLPANVPIIVAIDEPSLAEINVQWPWPRSLHARLVSALRAAGAKTIALDIIFSEPSTEAEDQALAAVLGPDVILAADESVISTPQASQFIRTLPLPLFTQQGASAGFATVSLHEDGVLRSIPAGQDSFAQSILRATGLTSPAVRQGLLLQFYGGPRTYPTVSYYQALDPDAFLPPGFFRDRIVIVGLSLQNAPSITGGGADAFVTPTTIHTGLLTAGAEIQTTILDNLRLGHGIAQPSAAASFPAILIAALLAALLVWGRTGWSAWAGAFLAVIGIVLASYLLLRTGRIFLSPVAPSVTLAGAVLFQSALDYVAERRSRRQITRAFSQYLSPALVEKLARDPSQLKLGGEKRELSILFCDVRGFSSVAERLKDDPQLLTQLVNRLLTPLSEVILRNGGTIDKYIGDCIMAFWNAPLPDPSHARSAVSAALEMVEKMAVLNAQLRAEASETGQPYFELRIGIGINTGECVVGNMGSDSRFDYSALGDAVNLASRLEGASKDYGVAIVVGEATADQAASVFRFRELESIVVKGRSEISRVFTPTGELQGSLRHGGDTASIQLRPGENRMFSTL